MRPLLKIFPFIFTAVFITQCEKEKPKPEVIIPDKNFLKALIDFGVDSNDDGKITIEEAEDITSLVISDDTISDITGIGSFVNLDSLDCSVNLLNCIDLSHNEKLIYLDCSSNKITSMNLSNNKLLKSLHCALNEQQSIDCSDNPLLEVLDCCFNRLTSLNVTGNPALRYLDCACFTNNLTTIDLSNNPLLEVLNCMSNELISLDISRNTLLNTLACSGNMITNIDISKNTLLRYIGLSGMQSLNKICVWELPFPPPGVSVSIYGSPNAYFSLDCSIK